MNYLITGGTGLIGSKLIKQLQQHNNNTITVLTRNIALAERKLRHKNIAFIDNLSLEHVNQKDVIINLAGEPIADKRWSYSQKEKICRSRWGITQQLAELIKHADTPPRTFISGSAIGIYGRQDKKQITEEFTDYHHEFTHDVCKRWEEIALQAQSNQTRVVLLRTGLVLATSGGALKKMKAAFNLGLGSKICHGQQMMSWIHIDDMVNAILHLINTESVSGPVNVTAPFASENAKFSHILAKLLSRPCAFTTPAWVLKVLLGEMSTLLIDGQNVYPEKLLKSGFTFSHPKLVEAMESLIEQPMLTKLDNAKVRQ